MFLLFVAESFVIIFQQIKIAPPPLTRSQLALKLKQLSLRSKFTGSYITKACSDDKLCTYTMNISDFIQLIQFLSNPKASTIFNQRGFFELVSIYGELLFLSFFSYA